MDINASGLAECVRNSNDLSVEEALDVYKRNLLLVVRGAAKLPGEGGKISAAAESKQKRQKGDGRDPSNVWWGLDELRAMYAEGKESFDETFCMENGRVSGISGQKKADASTLLGAGGPHGEEKDVALWYASFILQKDKTLFEKTIQTLPVAEPSCLGGSRHSDALWFFYGRNTSGEEMGGRPEHTDQIAHSGTWHLQLSGSKAWTLRANPQASGWKAAAGAPKDKQQIRVVLHPGDLIVVNTNSWFHATSIPDTSLAADALSLSYARDFYLPGTARPRTCDMTNVDGTWARHAVSAGKVILREPALACVQAAGNRAEFVACEACCRPVFTPGQHATVLAEGLSKSDIVAGKHAPPPMASLPDIPEGDDIPDPLFSASGKLVLGKQGCVFCSEACRDGDATLRVAELPKDHPLVGFVVHTLKHGHYQTFMMAAQIVVKALASGGDVDAEVAPVVALDKGGVGGWHEMVGREEGDEQEDRGGLDGVVSVTVFKERGEKLGLEVGDDMVVSQVAAGSPGEKAGVLVGDKVLSLAGAELEEGVFYEAMAQMEEESGKLADETMHLQFSTAWVGIEMEVKRGKKRKAADKAGSGGLKAVLQTGYDLLVAGLQAKGLEGVAERVPFVTFDRIMAGVHTASWEVDSLPGPLGMYIQALGHADQVTQQRAVAALQPLIGSVMDVEHQEVDMTVEDLQGGWVVLPRMSAQALFKATASLELSETPNCEVALAMGEGGLEAVIMALRDIAAGEPLTVGASGGAGGEDEDEDEGGESSEGEGEEEEE